MGFYLRHGMRVFTVSFQMYQFTGAMVPLAVCRAINCWDNTSRRRRRVALIGAATLIRRTHAVFGAVAEPSVHQNGISLRQLRRRIRKPPYQRGRFIGSGYGVERDCGAYAVGSASYGVPKSALRLMRPAVVLISSGCLVHYGFARLHRAIQTTEARVSDVK
jgi:hypothetical protein